MDSERLAAFESFLLDRMVATRLPGVACALLRDGAIVHARGLGFRDIERRLPVTPQTLFGIGSITKVFTALAILQLQERGLLRVDDPVSQYLEFGIASAAEPIRIRHLLAHSSGIPALGLSESKMSEQWFMTGFPVADERDLLTFLRGAADWVQAPPGKRWSYLNEGYLLLGAIIERVSHARCADYITEHILRPLAATQSTFRRVEVERASDCATPYLRDRDGRLFVGSNLYSEMPAAGGLVSSLTDMARLALLLLNEGRASPELSIVSPLSVQFMMEPAINQLHGRDGASGLPAELAGSPSAADRLPASDPYTPAYTAYHGHGLQLYENFYGHRVIGHGGGVMGGTSYVACIPAKQVGVVLLANGHGYPMGQLAMAALAGLLGEDFEQLPFIRRDRLLDALCGNYRSFRGTIAAEVRRRQELLELRLRFQHEDRLVPLIPARLDERAPRFVALANGVPMDVEFTRRGERVDLTYERYAFRRDSAAASQ